MSVDVELDYNTVIAGNSEINSEIDIEMSTNQEIEVYIEPREYKVVGDDVYIPINFDSAPTWLTQAITDLTNIKVTDVVTNLNSMINDLTYAVQQIEVAKNQYEQSIVALNNIDSRFNSVLTTLNSNMDGLDASLKDLIATKVTSTQASVVALNAITTAMNDTSTGSTLGSAILNLQTSITNLNNSTNTSLTSLESSINGAVDANAQAVEVINTYVGIDDAGASNGTGLLADVEILQKQNDGVIETTTGTYDVMISPENPDLAQLVITAEPYVTWKAADVSGIDTRLAHIGDVYVKYADTPNGAKEYVASYKFIRTVVDSTSPYATDSDGFTWALIIDQASQDAYTQALNAYDLADNKRRVFTITPSGSIDEGDLWVTGTNPQVVKVYKSGNWELSDTQVDNFISVMYTPTVTSLQNQIDGKVESWYTLSTNNPKTAWTDAATRSKHDGDLWYQTDTKLSYYYSSSTNSWNLIDDAKAIQALADAATAQATADGKISSYYMSTLALAQSMSSAWTATEKTNNIGDLVVVWNDSTLDNNGTWRWNGTSWVTTRDKKLVALASAVTALSTELDNGTNTWASADSTLENSLMTEISDEGARVESKFAYNSVVGINGVYKKSGFGLTTNYISGAGTQSNPYVSEFWIDASRLKFTNSNQTGQVAPFTIDASGVTPQITFNGKVSFSNVTGASMSGANLLYNSAPTIGFETKGWQADYNNTGLTSSGLLATGDPYRPIGFGAFHQFIAGTPAVGTVFDIRAVSAIPVIGGQYYEGSAYLNSHRCDSIIYIGWRDQSGSTITWSLGDIVTQTNTTNVLSAWGRSKFIAQAPANAASCYFYIRGIPTGEAYPYVFASMCYFGVASEGQTVYSNWSDGISASTSSDEVVVAINAGNTTTIDGGKITTGSITAAQINTTGLIAENISASEIVGKTITGGIINGAVLNGAVVKASYLDLDGELEVLTNYHITVAMYNANPSLYSDAVYISTSNEYRIPSISSITTLQKENVRSSSPYVPAGSYVLNSGIYSYATANVNSNMKAVKDIPTNIYISQSAHSNSLPENYLYSAVFTTPTAGSGYFRLYIGNLLILSVVKSGSTVSYSGLAGSGSITSPGYNNTNKVNLSYGGLTLSVGRGSFYGDRLSVTYGGATNLKILNSWTSEQIRVEANSTSESSSNTLIGFRLPAITINNMI